ncbi:MAG: CHAT domain-containing protein, partial [Planctomycetaceae bacterium]|nr:CHAT domain-containing protein [Planctomycetaceae bacterium]
NVGWVQSALGDDASATNNLKQAVEATRSVLERSSVVLSEQQQLAMAQTAWYQLNNYLSLASAQANRTDEAFAAILDWKGATLTRQRAMRLVAADPALAPHFQKLQQTAMRLATLSRAYPTQPDQVESWKKSLKQLRQERDRQEAALCQKSQTLRSAVEPVTLDAIKSALPEQTVLVDYFVFQKSDFGRSGTIGVALRSEGGVAIVEKTWKGFPADQTLHAGDRLIAMQEERGKTIGFDGKSLAEIVRLLRGRPETSLQLTIERENHKEPQTHRIARKASQLRSEPTLLASVVRSGHPVRMFDLGPMDSIREAIESWRMTFGGSKESRAAGQRLRRILWEPLLPMLAKAETILVSPDGALGRLPFGALPGRTEGTYLIENHRLVMIPVPRLLPSLVAKPNRRAEKSLLAMGAVDYDANPTNPSSSNEPRDNSSRRGIQDDRAGVLFKPLENTRDELAQIQLLFHNKFNPRDEDYVKLEGAAATEGRFRAKSPRCSYLHLATHGFFAPADRKSAFDRNPITQDNRAVRGLFYGDYHNVIRGFSPYLLSGLAFAGANRPATGDGDDGILTAEEIAFLPLGNVELATLSACDTGLGEVAGGEGLLGVQRAFQVAGARTTVASYWKVNDRATRLIMEHFYRNLWEKEMTRLDALREAQIWILKNPESISGGPDSTRGATVIEDTHNHRGSPYYWGAFVLSGDWR